MDAVAEATALTAHSHYATGADEAHGGMLLACREHVLALLERTDAPIDYPVAGLALFAIGAWGVLREAAPVDDAVALLVLAERFADNRAVPTMVWERVEAGAEQLAPGRIAALRATWTPRRALELLDDARGLLPHTWAQLARAADRAHDTHYSRLPAGSPWKRAEAAINAGDTDQLRDLLAQHPGLHDQDPGLTLLGRRGPARGRRRATRDRRPARRGRLRARRPTQPRRML